jgi:hypothetical protein
MTAGGFSQQSAANVLAQRVIEARPTAVALKGRRARQGVLAVGA